MIYVNFFQINITIIMSFEYDLFYYNTLNNYSSSHMQFSPADFLCSDTSRMKNTRQKPSQKPLKWREITQFTQAKQNTFILSSLLCILATIYQKRKTILMVNFSQERPLEVQCQWRKLLNCLNWPPVSQLVKEVSLQWYL